MKKAFTLIELLIVVAIIAILAAIAVPNFLEAQTRAKTSRVKNDMRALATGLEAYGVDNNGYLLCNAQLTGSRRPSTDSGIDGREILERLSTPVAYMSSGLLLDTFDGMKRWVTFSPSIPQGATLEDLKPHVDAAAYHYLHYGAVSPATQSFNTNTASPLLGPTKGWFLYSSGPDMAFTSMGTVMTQTDAGLISGLFYDSTNGTVSYGDLWRSGGYDIGATTGNLWGDEFFRQLHRNTR